MKVYPPDVRWQIHYIVSHGSKARPNNEKKSKTGTGRKLAN